MRTFFLTLLTTLFVSAMPLQAAYALADDGNSSTDKQTQQDCQTVESVLTPENRKVVEAAGGTIIELDGAQARAFQSRVEDMVNSKAPFTSDKILVVKPDSADDTSYNLGFFAEGCLKALFTAPAAIMLRLQGPAVPLDERG